MKQVFISMCVLWQALCFSQADSTHRGRQFIDSIHRKMVEPEEKQKATAVNAPPRDSTEAVFLRDSIKLATPKLVRIQARLDSRASSFQGTEVNIYGYYIGAMIKSKLSLGLAYYRISTVLPAKKVINGVNTGTSLVVNCGSFNSELIYFNRRYISLGFPLEFAVGQYNLTNTITDDNSVISQQIKFLAFINFGLSATFKPFQFIGLKLMAGYRKSIYPEEKVFEFNGVYSSLGLYVDVADIVHNIKMYKLMKRYNRVKNPLSTRVDLFTD
jgi:hypothetical protein